MLGEQHKLRGSDGGKGQGVEREQKGLSLQTVNGNLSFGGRKRERDRPGSGLYLHHGSPRASIPPSALCDTQAAGRRKGLKRE